MILLGFKNIKDNFGNVTHQRVEIIASSPEDTKESLSELYHAMVKKGMESKKTLSKLQDEIEFNDMSLEQYNKIEDKLLSDIQILKYERVLIIDGLILK